jgi:heat shock protein HslJ
MMKRAATMGVVLAAAVLGCKSAPTPSPSSAETTKLEGTNWVLISDVPEGVRPPNLTLESEGQKVVGFAGCNRMFGQYTMTGHTLYFNAMGTTKMACLGPAMDVEKQFLGVLKRTTSYTVSGDTLSLRDDDAELLRFRAVR